MRFVRQYSTNWDSRGDSPGTHGLSHSRTERDSMSVTRIASQLGEVAPAPGRPRCQMAEQRLRLVPGWAQGVSGDYCCKPREPVLWGVLRGDGIISQSNREVQWWSGGSLGKDWLPPAQANCSSPFSKEWGRGKALALALTQCLDSCQPQEREPTKLPGSQKIIQVTRAQPGSILVKE